VPLADFHIGSAQFRDELVYPLVDGIRKNPDTYVLLNGDLMDDGTRNSIADVYDQRLSPNEQLKTAIRILEPIKDRILSVCEGNHEYRIRRDTSIDVSELLAHELGAPYAREGALLALRFGKRLSSGSKRQIYTLYHTHGHGAGRTVGGKANKLVRLSDIVIADIYVISHIHTPMNTYRRIYKPDPHNKRVLEVEQAFVACGSLLDFGGYTEQKGYAPGSFRFPKIHLESKEKNIRIEI